MDRRSRSAFRPAWTNVNTAITNMNPPTTITMPLRIGMPTIHAMIAITQAEAAGNCCLDGA